MLLSLSFNSNATVKREGNIFIEDTIKAKPVKTPYLYKDKKGNTYVVYRSVKGKYYILKTSQKTGKQYKQYIKIEP